MADYYAWDVVYGDLPDASEYRENPLIAVENQIQRYNSTRKEQKDFTENLYKAYKDYLLKGNERNKDFETKYKIVFTDEKINEMREEKRKQDKRDAEEWEAERKHKEFIESLNTPEKIEELKNTINKYKNNHSYIWNKKIDDYLKNISFYDLYNFAQYTEENDDEKIKRIIF